MQLPNRHHGGIPQGTCTSACCSSTVLLGLRRPCNRLNSRHDAGANVVNAYMASAVKPCDIPVFFGFLLEVPSCIVHDSNCHAMFCGCGTMQWLLKLLPTSTMQAPLCSLVCSVYTRATGLG